MYFGEEDCEYLESAFPVGSRVLGVFTNDTTAGILSVHGVGELVGARYYGGFGYAFLDVSHCSESEVETLMSLLPEYSSAVGEWGVDFNPYLMLDEEEWFGYILIGQCALYGYREVTITRRGESTVEPFPRC
jgi:hypothetical protein